MEYQHRREKGKKKLQMQNEGCLVRLWVVFLLYRKKGFKKKKHTTSRAQPWGFVVNKPRHFFCWFILRHVILGTLATLGHLPVDILMRSFDVARLAVNAAVRGTAVLAKSFASSRTEKLMCGESVTYFCALIWKRTPWGLLSSSTYSYTPAGQKRFSRPW